MRISVVLPIYLNRPHLPELYRRLTTTLSASAAPYELVFVDDALVLEIAIGSPLRAQKLGPALLEIDQVVRMVQKTHPIGLGIANANRDLAAEHGVKKREW